MNNILKVTSLYDSWPKHVSVIRPLTKDDLVVDVHKNYATEDRPDTASLRVSVSLPKEDITWIVDTVGIDYFRKNDKVMFSSSGALRNIADTWNVAPSPYITERVVQSGYSRKRTAESKAQALKDANNLMETISPQDLIDDLVSAVNNDLAMLVEEWKEAFSDQMKRTLGQRKVQGDWLQSAIRETHHKGAYQTLSDEIESMNREIDELKEMLNKAQNSKAEIEYEVIRDLMVVDAGGKPEIMEVIDSVKLEPVLKSPFSL